MINIGPFSFIVAETHEIIEVPNGAHMGASRDATQAAVQSYKVLVHPAPF